MDREISNALELVKVEIRVICQTMKGVENMCHSKMVLTSTPFP